MTRLAAALVAAALLLPVAARAQDLQCPAADHGNCISSLKTAWPSPHTVEQIGNYPVDVPRQKSYIYRS